MKNNSECKCGKGAGCCKNKVNRIRRQTGEHHFSNPTNGIPRCVTCGCDEDDAFVGGELCDYEVAKRDNHKLNA